jgi:hypothetical protein
MDGKEAQHARADVREAGELGREVFLNVVGDADLWGIGILVVGAKVTMFSSVVRL